MRVRQVDRTRPSTSSERGEPISVALTSWLAEGVLGEGRGLFCGRGPVWRRGFRCGAGTREVGVVCTGAWPMGACPSGWAWPEVWAWPWLWCTWGGAFLWAGPPRWAWPPVWGRPHGAASPHRMGPLWGSPPMRQNPPLTQPHSFTPPWGRRRAMGPAPWGHPGGLRRVGPMWGSPRRCGADGHHAVTFVTELRSPVSMGPLESWRW